MCKKVAYLEGGLFGTGPRVHARLERWAVHTICTSQAAHKRVCTFPCPPLLPGLQAAKVGNHCFKTLDVNNFPQKTGHININVTLILLCFDMLLLLKLMKHSSYGTILLILIVIFLPYEMIVGRFYGFCNFVLEAGFVR